MTTPRKRTTRNKGRRSEIETELRDHFHVDWTYVDQVDVTEFDIDKSLRNQARFEAIDEPTVELYKEAIERGDEFPAVIAIRSGPRAATAKLVSIDGNHRLVAHDRAQRPIDVYEVDRATKPAQVALMTYYFNTRHGRPTSEAERLHQALFLIANGATQESAANTVNIQAGVLKRAIAKAKADERADEVGVDRREWDSLSQVMRSRLLNVATDEGFHGAVHLAHAAHLSSQETLDLVTLLNTSKSARKQREILTAETARFQERIQTGGSGALTSHGRKPTTPRGRLSIVLGQLTALPDDWGAIASSFTDEEKTETASRVEEQSQRLHKLALTLNPELS